MRAILPNAVNNSTGKTCLPSTKISARSVMPNHEQFQKRVSPLAISSQQFRELGAQLIDRIASFLDSLPQRPVTPGEAPTDVRLALAADRTLPSQGVDPSQLLDHAADLMFDHFSLQRASSFLGIRHLLRRAHRCPRRSACRRRQPQCRRMALVAHGQ